eukprot:157228_1
MEISLNSFVIAIASVAFVAGIYVVDIYCHHRAKRIHRMLFIVMVMMFSYSMLALSVTNHHPETFTGYLYVGDTPNSSTSEYPNKPCEHTVDTMRDKEESVISASVISWLLLLAIIMACAICKYLQYNHDVFVIHNALVIVIGIGIFDDKNKRLPGVKKCVEYLIQLWRYEYRYDVVICNEKSLYSTKQNIQDFIDAKIKMLEEKDYDCVMMHNLSHGHGSEGFQTSDGKNIDLEFIIHEIQTKASDTNNLKLVKVIFQHVCQGHADYSLSINRNRGGLSIFECTGDCILAQAIFPFDVIINHIRVHIHIALFGGRLHPRTPEPGKYINFAR